MPDSTDWVSAISGLVATVIALITLFTVYAAALQLLSQRREHRHSRSYTALGPWRTKALSSSLFGLRTSISTPNVSLARLIQQKWSPQLEFPLGIETPSTKRKSWFRDVEKASEARVLARSSWVNFMQALGLSPSDERFFEMQFESALLAGRVPMRWKGPDLVGLCAMLGFQSHEGKPSFSSPVPLPLQWTGPLGWVQFRDGFEGCVAEFRRRNDMVDVLSKEVCQYFQSQGAGSNCALLPRLCHALGGLCIDVDGQDRLFYVGPQDFERTIHFFLEAWKQDEKGEGNKRDDDKKSGNGSAISGSRPGSDTGLDTDTDTDSSISSERTSVNQLFDDLENKSLSDEEILEKLWGVQQVDLKRKGLGVKRSELRGDLAKSAPEEIKKKQRKERGLKEALVPCPGLLSVVIQGEMATSCGLDITDCVEYHRIFSLDENLTGRVHPYHLGNMYMDRETLKLFKNALSRLRPDGFYFSPSGVLSADLTDIYSQVRKGLFGTDQICPTFSLEAWNDDNNLFWAVRLCNEMQAKRRTARATFSVGDMIVLSKASTCLQSRSASSADLFWAMIVCPALFVDVRTHLQDLDIASLRTLLASEFHVKNEVMVACGLPKDTKARKDGAKDDSDSEVSVEEIGRTGDDSEDYFVPECSDGVFKGSQIIVAFFDVCLTFYWIEKRWVTDVSMYTAAMPPTVMML